MKKLKGELGGGDEGSVLPVRRQPGDSPVGG